MVRIFSFINLSTKRFSSFLKKINWVSLLFGAAIGYPIWWSLQDLTKSSNSLLSPYGELIAGVILGGIVGWVIPEFINDLNSKWSVTKPLRAVLGTMAENDIPTIICLGSLFPKDTGSFLKNIPYSLTETVEVVPKTSMPWIVIENDARTLGFIMATLAMAGKSDNLNVIRDDLSLDITDANIICIGSIKNNYKTKQINSAFFKLPYRFEWCDEELIIRGNNKIWTLEEEFDYGILARIPNEYNEDKSILIFAGISSYGTVGSAYYFYKNWKKIYAKVNQKSFAFVIKARRDNFQYIQIDDEKIV